MLNLISGGATARPFITHHNTLDLDMYMRIATELHLKRLIVGGMERVYEIGRIFRNEGMDTRHNPEFTTVELYEAYADFNDMMDLFEELLSSAALEILGTYKAGWLGEEIDLTPGWPRLTMADAVKNYLGIDFMAIGTDEEALIAAKSVGVDIKKTKQLTWGSLLYECFDQKCRTASSSRRLSQCTRSTCRRLPKEALKTPGLRSASSCSSARTKSATLFLSSTTR